MGYFGVNALFLDFFAGLLKGLFGYGYWLAGPSLVLAGLILIFHRGRPVQLRTTCALLLPLLFGSLTHLVFCKKVYEPSFFKMLGAIWADGVALESGGAVSGVLANGSAAVFSSLASVILFTVLFVTLLFVALRLTLAAFADWRRARPQYEEQPEPPPGPSLRLTFPWTARSGPQGPRNPGNSPASSATRRTPSPPRTRFSRPRRPPSRNRSPLPNRSAPGRLSPCRLPRRCRSRFPPPPPSR